jgi:hypothetical protein
MRYTTEDGGRLNNYAIEPKMYQSEPPTTGQKRLYIILGAVALTLVGSLVYIAAAVSA